MAKQQRNMLEPEFAEPYMKWRTEQTPENNSAMLNAVQPILNKGVAAYAGPNPSPITQSRARLIALKALQTYDPGQARLSTHITNHLQGLRRITDGAV